MFKQIRNIAVLTGLALSVLVFTFSSAAQKVRLRSQSTPACATSSSAKFADIYGDGNIAVLGSYNCRGAFIYDITNPDAPVLANWYNPGANQQFLEAIVIGNRGYFGSGNGGGVHIVDLTNPYSPTLLGIVNSASGNAFNSIHEMNVFSQNGATYLIENFNGVSSTKLLKVINVTNPAAPVFIRDINPTEVQWIHAMHIRGNRLFTSGWGNASNRGRTEIYDITNIGTQAPSLLGFIQDQSASVTAGNNMHSSWSSEDGNYLYSARETSNGSGDVRVYNISNPAAPTLVNSLTMNGLNLNAVTPHNPVVMGNKLYVSWYQAGVQVFDITTPSQPKRIGQYDTYYPQFAPDEAAKNALTEEPWDIVCGTSSFQNALPTTYDGNWAVYPFLGETKVLAGDLTFGLLVLDVSKANAPRKNVVSDFDGDGKTDYSTFTPSNGVWAVENSSTGAVSYTNNGLPNDKAVAADYDGDSKSDIAVFRPSTGQWWILNSGNGSVSVVQFGIDGDVPVEADYDADGKADFGVYRPSTGVWWIMQTTVGMRVNKWGLPGDIALTGDFEGDGKADLVTFRPSDRTWYILQSSSTIATYAQFGLAGDRPLSGDFDGDGLSDIGVFRPSTGVWYIRNSKDYSYSILQFGLDGDIPIPSDFDGDGRADFAVFRPSNSAWYRLNSADNAFSERVFGQPGDVPSPNASQGE